MELHKRLELFISGNETRAYDYMGAHFETENGEQATNVCLYRLTTDGIWKFTAL